MAFVAEDIGFTYSGADAPVLKGFSATFQRGRITAVTGRNGSGKTTLAKILIGILKPAAGTICLDGTFTAGMTLTEMGRQVGLVMQDPSRQLFCTSVKDEIDFGLKNLGLSVVEIESRRKEYLSYFDLEKYEGQFPYALSTGEKQRLVLAAVLAMKPSYLILDEPTSALDKGRRRALGKYLSEQKETQNIGIILISHDEDFIAQYADTRITLENRGDL